ncbi:protein NRT1/ PTR FAMILY 2.13-like [Prosopis cineraria]|uniref:protein NRT1/ PTR FAMILY 2.13-like n=1 Tax=Prosopis cineraria TaxID=364024 RepID=UPI00240FD918|nr:protein NRT1/ PTR FAMILY 2.13-like [Prosopis cineraria]
MFVAGAEERKTQKKQPGGWKAIAYILGNETFERLAVFGLLANFLVYLTRELHMDQVSAATIMSLWFGLSNFGPLIGAFVSDAYAGRFATIAFASFFSLLGMIVMTLTAWSPELHPPPCTAQEQELNQCVKPTKTHIGVLTMGLLLLAIGSSGVRPCSIPFGVDQFDADIEEGRKGINSFFNWYYTSFSIVLLINQTLVVYVQDSVSWKIGFGIPTVCMFFSIIMFFVGTRVYVYVKPEGSIFSGVAQVLVAAYRKRKLELPDDSEKENVDEAFYDPPLKNDNSVSSKLPLTNQYRMLNKAALIMEDELNPDGSRKSKWRLASVKQVEEVKCLARTLPIWVTGILSYIPVAQQTTFTVSQALRMDRHLGHRFQIPAGSILVMSNVAVCFFVPLYDRFLVPALRKMTHLEGGITLLQRIGIGMVLSELAMVAAGLVEAARRDSANSTGFIMSVFWLVPQLVLMGLSEAMNIIGQIEFFNKQFPEHIKSTANSLVFCSLGIANYLNSLLMTIVHYGTRRQGNWLADDLNVGRLDYFYYLITVIGGLNLVLFIWVARTYEYKESLKVHNDDDDAASRDHDVESQGN